MKRRINTLRVASGKFSGSFHEFAGFTLLELLIVVAILSALAFGAVSMVDEAEEHVRFDTNKSRLINMRYAIVGNVQGHLADPPIIHGYVADMGRLPNSVAELLSQGSQPSWGYHTNSDMWAGWRGPYIETFSSSNGSKSYSDGWGNYGDTNNFGWRFEVDQDLGTLLVQSYGADGVSGGTGYNLDYPQNGLLVHQHEALIDITRWRVQVILSNPSGTGGGDDDDDDDDDSAGEDLPGADTYVRLHLHYPSDGDLDWPATWPATDEERDAAPYLTKKVKVDMQEITEGGSKQFEFDFGETTKKVPFGVRTITVVENDTGNVFGTANDGAIRVELLPRTQLPTHTITWELE